MSVTNTEVHTVVQNDWLRLQTKQTKTAVATIPNLFPRNQYHATCIGERNNDFFPSWHVAHIVLEFMTFGTVFRVPLNCEISLINYPETSLFQYCRLLVLILSEMRACE